MKRFLVFFILMAMSVVIMAGFIGGTSAFAATGQSWSLRMGHFLAEEHPTGLASEIFAEEVENRTNGRVTIEIFPNNTLGSTPEVADMVRLGVVDLGIYTTGQLSAYANEFYVPGFPYFFDNHEHVFASFAAKPGQMLKDKALEVGFVVLNLWDNGFRQFTNNVRPLNAPQDFVGLRMRVPPELAMEASVRTLGATPTTIAFAELYMALAQGVADGQENPLGTIYTARYFEAQRYLAKMDYMYNTSTMMFNPNVWNSFPPDIQQAIQEASDVATAAQHQMALEFESMYIRELTETHGMEITYPDPEPFRIALAPVTEELLQVVDRAWYEEFVAAVDEVRQSMN